MDAQLRLLTPAEPAQSSADEPTGGAVGGASAFSSPASWRLSNSAREIGRKGVAQARAALLEARRVDRDDDHADRRRSHAA
jgi:hypothetical protein